MTPLGINTPATWSRLLDGCSGIVGLRAEHVPPEHRAVVHKLPSQVVGAVDMAALSAVHPGLEVGSDCKNGFLVRSAVALLKHG